MVNVNKITIEVLTTYYYSKKMLEHIKTELSHPDKYNSYQYSMLSMLRGKYKCVYGEFKRIMTVTGLYLIDHDKYIDHESIETLTNQGIDRMKIELNMKG